MPILIIVATCLVYIFSVLNYEFDYKTNTIKIEYSDLLPANKKQVDCLAQNIYFEAGIENDKGKEAVAMVTLNRVNHKAWPNSICEVVKEKGTRVCQFSWWCETKNKQKAIYHNYTTQEKRIYNRARQIALHVYMNYDELKEKDVTGGALFYHADYVNPGWKLSQTTKIGKHIFYKKT